MTRSATLFAAALAAAASAAPLAAQRPAADTLPEAVVQRFVDAANARQLDAMMAVVAPEAVFNSLPESARPARGRDSIRAVYARGFSQTAAGYTVRVASRIVDGPFVVDLELLSKADGAPAGHATWTYYVTGGQIQRAWALRAPRAAAARE